MAVISICINCPVSSQRQLSLYLIPDQYSYRPRSSYIHQTPVQRQSWVMLLTPNTSTAAVLGHVTDTKHQYSGSPGSCYWHQTAVQRQVLGHVTDTKHQYSKVKHSGASLVVKHLLFLVGFLLFVVVVVSSCSFCCCWCWCLLSFLVCCCICFLVFPFVFVSLVCLFLFIRGKPSVPYGCPRHIFFFFFFFLNL